MTYKRHLQDILTASAFKLGPESPRSNSVLLLTPHRQSEGACEHPRQTRVLSCLDCPQGTISLRVTSHSPHHGVKPGLICHLSDPISSHSPHHPTHPTLLQPHRPPNTSAASARADPLPDLLSPDDQVALSLVSWNILFTTGPHSQPSLAGSSVFLSP